MSKLRAAVDDYLALRRSLGFQLKGVGVLLASFADYLEEIGASHVTTDLALAWATQPQGVHPIWWRQRLGAVRDFARHQATIDPSTEVPPRDLISARQSRVTPYLYSDDEIARLMTVAQALSPALRAATHETLVGVLAVTGLRIGEAIRLDQRDIDPANLLLVVRDSKHDSSREVPLHESTMKALSAYARLRDDRFPEPESRRFFVSIRGTRLCQSAVNETFRQMVRHAGLDGRGERCRPRIHDLRHTFAVATLLRWYRSGVDVDAWLPRLSTVLGHVNPASTYWYLEAAPELLALAAERLEDVLGASS